MMKKIILVLIAVLVVSVGYTRDLNDNTRTATQSLYKPAADNPLRSIVNIGNWAYWIRDNGESAFTPSGASGGIYPRGSAPAIFLDGIVVGGYQNGLLKVSGQTHHTGTEPGYIKDGQHVTKADDPRVRIYRIRKDWETLTANQVRQGAKELNELANLTDVTTGQIDEIIAQYKKDWEEWPTEIGAPFYDLNNNGIYEPDLDETPGIANADQVVWFPITDANRNTTSTGFYGTDPIGLEMQYTLWAYNQPGGGLGQIVFKQIRLINKGDGDLTDAYISLFSDPDLGDYSDDLIGMDVDKSLMYVYNGAVTDPQYAEFGMPPPAAGYDFFAGPIVESPGDVAIFDLKPRPGYKNLPASSFGYYGDADNSDPGPQGDVEAAREYYNLMRGFRPFDDLENPTPWLDAEGNETKFPYMGDPVTGIGHLDSSPGDRRMLMNSGPFTLAEGDTQDIVVAVVGGMGDNNLSSITALRNNDVVAQALFDDLFASIPSSPPQPNVKVITMDEHIMLDWGSVDAEVKAIEQSAGAGYEFQGYNVWQLPNATAGIDRAVRIATFDKIDGITTIYGPKFLPEFGEVVNNVPIQFGSDVGLQRQYQVTKNHLTGSPLLLGSTYYFGVTAYNYNEAPSLITDTALESGLLPIIVTLSAPPLDTEYSAIPGDAISATHSAGTSGGSVDVTVIDPTKLTGDDYEVFFDYGHYYLDVDGLWKHTAEPDAIAKLLDVSLSVVTGSAVVGPGGTIDLNFEVDVISPDGNWVSGALITVPGAVINSATGPSGIVTSIQADGQSVLFGDLVIDGAGDFAGGEVVTINVTANSVSIPIGFSYVLYDDGWASLYCPDNMEDCIAWGIPGPYVNTNAEGSGTIDELGYSFKSLFQWNVRNIDTGELVIIDQTTESGIAAENIVDGVLVPEHTVGENDGPRADGLLFVVNGAAIGFKSAAEIAYGGTVLAAPDGVWHSLNSNATYYLSAGGGSGNWDRLERYIAYAAPHDFEMRFTDGPNYGVQGFTTDNIISVPFELWDIGIATPDDPSDDNRMIPFVYENAARNEFGYDGDTDPYFGFVASDWVYWMDPDLSTGGYTAFAATCDAAGGPGNTYPYASDGSPDGYHVNMHGGFVYPIGRMIIGDYNLGGAGIPSGTTIRLITYKPNAVTDMFTFNAPAKTVSDALAKEAVKLINVFPNPYYASNSLETNRFDNFVTFTHLPQKAKIRIFSLDGKIVREYDKNTDSQYFKWDLRNHTDIPVASGVYIVHIDMEIDGQGLGEKILKVFIVQPNQVVKYY